MHGVAPTPARPLVARLRAAWWPVRCATDTLLSEVTGIGDKIGDYEIAAKLKSGGMATLYLGRRAGAAGFARHVAIKLVHPHLSEDANFVSMFIDEAKLSARIQHPNVVHVEQFGESGGSYYLVMEYVHGCSLSELLKGLGQRKRRLTPDVAVSITMKLAEGLHAAHEIRGDDGELLGVVHRDVSPQNVLLAYKGHVKLIDFGIAKARGRSQETVAGLLKGKFRYMAPEQAAGLPVDRRSDEYALGIALWEMLTGRRLFKADNDLLLLDMVRSPRIQPPSTGAPGISPELDAVVMKALAPNPKDRYPTCADFRRALAQAVPQAFLVDSERIAALLKTVMGDEIRAVQSDLPGSVSELVSESALRRSQGQTGPDSHAGPAPGGLPEPKEEVLHTMTLSVEDLEMLEAEFPRPSADAFESPPAAASSTPTGSTTSPTTAFAAPTPKIRLPLARLAMALAAIALLAFGAGYFLFAGATPSDAALSNAAGPVASAPAAATSLPIAATPVAAPPAAVVTVAPPAIEPVAIEDAGAPPSIQPPTPTGRRHGRIIRHSSGSHEPVAVMTPIVHIQAEMVAVAMAPQMTAPVIMAIMHGGSGDPLLVDDDF